MSRKILFSGKRIDNDEWVYGDLLTGGVDFVCAIRVHGANENNSSAIIAVHPETVGQCTGVSDKNGKLMFEGDIVNGIFFFGHQVPGVVAFREGAFGVKWRRGNVEEFTAFCQTCNMEWEVVGRRFTIRPWAALQKRIKIADDLVEKALECCVNGEQLCDTCPYDENGYEQDGSCIQDLICDMYGYVKRLRIENAELEARLEKAEELPCKVGDTIYAIDSFGPDAEIQELEVEEIRIRRNHSWISAKLKDFDILHNYISMENGIWWFTDRETAEARLKELQGGKR